MKIILNLLLAVIVFSCSQQSEKEKQAKQIEASYRKVLSDGAFKENSEIEIHELKVISIDTIDQNDIDTIYLQRVNEYYEQFEELKNLTVELAKSKKNTERLYSLLNSSELVKIQHEEVMEEVNKARSYLDSMIYYLRMDSIIRNRITKRKTAEEFFEAKIFIKTTSRHDGKSENQLDTIYPKFTKQFKYLPLNEF